jgi:GT2 family glycosyltransferase
MNAQKVYIVIPNWNGATRLRTCLDSLRDQTQQHQVIVVDNGSVDGSVDIIQKEYPKAILIQHDKNKGFAGGVNPGIKYAINESAKYVALLNNDAVADKSWLKHLVEFLETYPKAGIVAAKMLDERGQHIDSTGECYTIWGLPFPRGKDEADENQYDKERWIFGASGGASIYRIKMLEQIGLFDEDFFAYYEDVDISFRAQLAGWRVGYEPKSKVSHQIGATSGKIKGFTTYHTLKNLPLLMWKNVPRRLMLRVWPRLFLAYWLIAGRALRRGLFGAFIKGITMGIILWPKKLVQRYNIQRNRQVTTDYINSIITHDLPPNAHNLRSLRTFWWKLRGKRV